MIDKKRFIEKNTLNVSVRSRIEKLKLEYGLPFVRK